MNYKKEKMGPYNLHLIKTDKFKTISIEFKFRGEITEEKITYNNLLARILNSSTKKFPNKRLLAIENENLYDLSYEWSCSNIGKNYILSALTTFICPKYTEENMLEKSIDHIFDCIFNPNINNNKFNEEEFKLAFKKTEKAIKSIKEDMRRYSLIKLNEIIGKNTPIAYNPLGNINILSTINEENLYNYYTDIVNHSIVDIFVIGDIDFSTISKLIKEKCPIKTIKKPKEDIIIEHDQIKSRIKKEIENDDIIQAKLSVGCKIKGLTEFERKYVSSLFNLIYGGSLDSKLFRIVREKYSLAYYVGSKMSVVDNVMIISAGIENKTIDKVIRLYKKLFMEMKDGKFDEEDINNAKTCYKSALKSFEDSPFAIINNYYNKELFDIDSIEERIKKIETVTKEDIAKLASKVHFDSVFVVKGDNNEKN